MKRSHLAIVLIVSILTAGVLAMVLLRRGAHLQVSVAQATTGDIRRQVLTTGKLEPATAVEVGSQVSGSIQSLGADFNSIVKAGQVIAQIDPSRYDTELAQARAGVGQADADAQVAKVELDDAVTKASRAQELASQGLITQAELDGAALTAKEAGAVYTAATAATRVAKAELSAAQLNRDRTTIRSPIDGIVVSRNVEVGQTIAASFASPVLFRIANLERMQLLADVGESEAGGVEKGSKVDFEIESVGARRFVGAVEEVRLQPIVENAGAVGTSGSSGASSGQPAGASTSATSSTQTASATAPSVPAGSVVSYIAVVDVDNSDRGISPGSTAIVTLPTARRSQVLRVPNAAISFRPDPAALESTGQKDLEIAPIDRAESGSAGTPGYVWKYDGRVFIPIAVTTGASDERWTEILTGDVKAGDALVTGTTLQQR